MATKKKVPEKKVVEKKNQCLVINWGSLDFRLGTSVEDVVTELLESGDTVGDIKEDNSFLLIKDGEICEIVDLTIDIPKVVPIVKFKTV